jgi:AcrR family transcriptional regulator
MLDSFIPFSMLVNPGAPKDLVDGPDDVSAPTGVAEVETCRRPTKRRILEAARALLEEGPDVAPTIAKVAEPLTLSRPTVYRYFQSAHALPVASVIDGIDDLLDGIAEPGRNQTEAAAAVVEGITYTKEQIPLRHDLALFLVAAGPPHEVTSDTSLALGRSTGASPATRALRNLRREAGHTNPARASSGWLR